MRKWLSKTKEEGNPDITSLARTTERLIERVKKKHSDACNRCEDRKADKYHWWLKYYHGVRAALSKTEAVHPIRSIWTVKTSSMFLNEIKQLLIDGSGNENECYCTGIMDSDANIGIPTQILALKTAKQTPVFAEGDVTSVYETLSSLDDWGHPALLFCHNHPGKGPGATRPSGIDLGTHRDLEVCYPIIGVIFSQDGYVRFFSAGKEFRVEIFGKGVVKVDDDVYHIQN